MLQRRGGGVMGKDLRLESALAGCDGSLRTARVGRGAGRSPACRVEAPGQGSRC